MSRSPHVPTPTVCRPRPTARRPRAAPSRGRRGPGGFTLVELLVVIGIIALLISILLPALSKAREQGNTIKCLANLRSIGQAAKMYENANNGIVLPADVMDAKFPVSLSYQDVNETWATILVSDKYLAYPEVTSTTEPPGNDNVFRCPSGVLETSAVAHNSTTVPASRKDAQGAMACVSSSTRLSPGLNVFTWYGVNATNDTSTPGYRLPMARCQIDASGKVSSQFSLTWRKVNQIKSATEIVTFFDGLYGFNYITGNANRINARHGGQKFTNCAFADGHAETVKTDSIPGGDKVAKKDDFYMANIGKWPSPKWRMEQN
jgi:prepilin-type N-terminal cleavage/methylation domain-containing protein/prepilin-type processing-associated H-X9-DG protein